MINIRTKYGVFTPKFHTFSGGEEHVNISHINLKLDKNDNITIECRINSSQELIRYIFCPYIPQTIFYLDETLEYLKLNNELKDWKPDE